MRYAIFSDIHANAQAWSRVMADADAVGVDVYVCLGDVVGYGPKPLEVLNSIRQRTANFVLGNHDAAATGALDASLFNDQARAVVEWTRTKLDREALDFLSAVPLAIEDSDLLFVHAEVAEPGRYHYIEDAATAAEHLAATSHRVVFIGHTHHPAVFVARPSGEVFQAPDQDLRLEAGHRYLINVGSAGEPRNPEDLRARYAIYDSETEGIYFRRLDFDIEAYRADLDASGLSIRPYFLQIADHQAQAGGGSDRAMIGEVKSPARPAQVEMRPRQLVVAPLPAASLPPPAPSPLALRPAAFLILIAGVVALVALSGWLIQKRQHHRAAAALPPAWEMLVQNGGFESPRIGAQPKALPAHWESNRADVIEMAERRADAYAGFQSAEGSQVLSLLPGGALFQPIGAGILRPGATYTFRFVQYEPTDIGDGGSGVRVELWEGSPTREGRLLATREFAATGAGRAEARVARLQAPERATHGAELYLCLRNIPDPDTAAIGTVTIDAVVHGEMELP